MASPQQWRICRSAAWTIELLGHLQLSASRLFAAFGLARRARETVRLIASVVFFGARGLLSVQSPGRQLF